MNSCVFDIETTSLGAVGAGILLAVCVRPTATQRTRSFRLDQYDFKASKEYGIVEREEKALLTDVMDELDKYDVLIGHNVIRYDIPYLKSRAFQRDMETKPVVVYDTLTAFRRTGYLTIPNGFGKPSGGLAMVADFLHVKQLKTSIFPHDWWETIWAKEAKRKESMDEIVDHCSRDVRLNANVFRYLWNADPRPALKKIY
ncbi:MAG TPA: ribonuclease H-like domain-containing protein [Anaerolineales bacterium]|nr:ribonuclease H-like domain-containing protein [Anaerolineales bacterium]